MRIRIRAAILLMLCWCIAGHGGGLALATSFEYLCVSAVPQPLHGREAIYGYTFLVKGRAVFRIRTPFQWNIRLDNSTGGQSVIKAHTVVGAWAIREEDLNYFREFVEVGKLEDVPLPEPFNVTLKLMIVNEDTGEERPSTLPPRQLTLKRCGAP